MFVCLRKEFPTGSVSAASRTFFEVPCAKVVAKVDRVIDFRGESKIAGIPGSWRRNRAGREGDLSGSRKVG